MGRHDLAYEHNNAKRAHAEGGDEPKKSKKAHVGWKNPSMVRYLNEARWERNKLRRVLKHARRHRDDLQALAWLKEHAPSITYNALVAGR